MNDFLQKIRNFLFPNTDKYEKQVKYIVADEDIAKALRLKGIVVKINPSSKVGKQEIIMSE